jgi:parvulin-like peptidyl-prolyl isomerase
MIPIKRRWLALCFLTPVMLAQGAVVAAEGADQAATKASPPAQAVAAMHSDIFATVNGKSISVQEYENAFAAHVRQKFYHREIPAGQLAEARRDVRDKVVQRVLLLEEAERRDIVPDAAYIDKTIAGYDERYANSAAWKENREKMLPALKKQLGEQNQLAQLEQQVRTVPDPSEAEVKAYYEANPNLFTEPEKLRLSAILLAVDPSSTSAVWAATREEAQAIYRRLLAGADFAESSRLHSNSKYAESGGDMGYLHRGMVPEPLQERIDKFEIGKVNEPIDTLEGVAIFRLDERVPPKKRDFADVAQRARELLARERQEAAWKDLLAKRTAAADIKIHHQLGMGQGEGGN